MADNFSDLIADEYTSHGIGLQRFASGEKKRVLAALEELEKDLRAKLVRIAPDGSGKYAYWRSRLQRLLAEVTTTIESAYAGINLTQTRALEGFAAHEAEWARLKINGIAGFGLMDAKLTKEQLRAAVSKWALIEGAPSSEWWDRQGKDFVDKFSDAVRLGYLGGESMEDIGRRVRDVTGIKRKQAEALVRTSVQSVAAAARKELYQANKDVLKGIQQVSTLDGRTTPVCAAYDGAAWDMDGNPIEGNELSYAGGVPRHWRCRSTEIPIVKSWRDLGVNRDEMPASTRASMDGQVSEKIGFGKWLSKHDEAFQNKLLGQGRAQLWRDGKITLTDLVNQNGRELTLSELVMFGETGVKSIGAQEIFDLYNSGKLDLEAAREQMHELLFSGDGSFGWGDVSLSGLDDQRAKNAQEGLDFVGKILGGARGERMRAGVLAEGLSFRKARGNRSFYEILDPQKGQTPSVMLAKKWASTKDVIHELGHYLEDLFPDFLDSTRSEFLRRTRGERFVRLSSVLRGSKYGAGELTKPDKLFHAYMGKVYFNAQDDIIGTEILSMALELFYKNPLRLFEKDPETFDFLFRLFKGNRP